MTAAHGGVPVSPPADGLGTLLAAAVARRGRSHTSEGAPPTRDGVPRVGSGILQRDFYEKTSDDTYVRHGGEANTDDWRDAGETYDELPVFIRLTKNQRRKQARKGRAVAVADVGQATSPTSVGTSGNLTSSVDLQVADPTSAEQRSESLPVPAQLTKNQRRRQAKKGRSVAVADEGQATSTTSEEPSADLTPSVDDEESEGTSAEQPSAAPRQDRPDHFNNRSRKALRTDVMATWGVTDAGEARVIAKRLEAYAKGNYSHALEFLRRLSRTEFDAVCEQGWDPQQLHDDLYSLSHAGWFFRLGMSMVQKIGEWRRWHAADATFGFKGFENLVTRGLVTVKWGEEFRTQDEQARTRGGQGPHTWEYVVCYEDRPLWVIHFHFNKDRSEVPAAHLKRYEDRKRQDVEREGANVKWVKDLCANVRDPKKRQ